MAGVIGERWRQLHHLASFILDSVHILSLGAEGVGEHLHCPLEEGLGGGGGVDMFSSIGMFGASSRTLLASMFICEADTAPPSLC